MTPKDKKRADPAGRRASLLRAALAVLERKDYHDVTMEEVAREAGVAKGTPYLYFPTKEKLFTVLVQDMREGLEGSWRLLWKESAPGLGRLKAFVRHQLDFFENHKGLFLQIIRGNLPGMCPGKDKDSREMIAGTIGFMEKALAEAVKGGQVRRLDARAAATALFGMIRGYVFVRIVGIQPGPLAKNFDAVWDVFLRGVEK